MKHKQIVPHSVAKQLFVTGGWSQHGLKEGSKEEHSTGQSKLLGMKYSKHGADFQYYYPNTISYKTITIHKPTKMHLSRNGTFFLFLF